MLNNAIPIRIIGFAALPLALTSLVFAQIHDKDKKENEEVYELCPFEVTSFGATPGGAQDINYARSQIDLGNIPHPNTFQAEGLLSEHDLPLDEPASRSRELLSIYGQATPVSLLELPEASHLAQIGFASGLDPKTWRRAPLNLIAVVDKSGSMSGQPLELVRQSLLTALAQLDEDDQIGIVLYGDRSHVYLDATRVTDQNRTSIESAIRAIASAGSTNMEHGLAVGYELAERSSKGFDGTTRLMLFTDERPNTGDTSEHGFMGQMRNGSRQGFGLTTIGVGVQFDAELANTLSSVRGGNLFYFPDRDSMVEKFRKEFDTFVTELAYDLKMTIKPAAGFRIAGVYGVPGDMLKWDDDERSISLEVETIFLSLRKGAIYFALAPLTQTDLPQPKRAAIGEDLARVELAYTTAGSERPTRDEFAFKSRSPERVSLGLRRGALLVNEYISLKKAATAHHVDNDQETAFRIVSALGNLLRAADDSDLDSEVEFVEKLESQLSLLSGHGAEIAGHVTPAAVRGLWIGHPEDNPELDDPVVLQFIGDRIITVSELDEDGAIDPTRYLVTREPLPSKRRGYASVLSKEECDATPAALDGVDSNCITGADYADDIASIEYRVSGKKLTLKLFEPEKTHKFVLYRYDGYNGTDQEIESADLDPFTGLPKRT